MNKHAQKVNNRGELTMRASIRWQLVIYDLLIYLAVSFAFLIVYPANYEHLTPTSAAYLMAVGVVLIFGFRFVFNVYRQIWKFFCQG